VFQIGFAPARNFILFAELGTHLLSEPEVERGRVAMTATNTEFSVFSLGGGITFYSGSVRRKEPS
jgi:hypothetical protein